jgi:antitoxin HicB
MSMVVTTAFDTGSLLFHITNSQRDGQEIMAANQKRTFAVVLQPEEEGGFTVRVPLLPEIVTFGRDEREALAMAEDAIRLVIEDCSARGEPIPVGGAPRIREITVTLAA